MKLTHFSENIFFLTGDACSLELPGDSVDLIVTNPPYLWETTDRWGGDGSNQINASADESVMLDLLLKATNEMFRMLKPGGNLVIANSSKDRFDLKYALKVMETTEFVYLDTVVQNSYAMMGPGEFPFNTIDRNCLTYWYHFRKPGGQTVGNTEYIVNDECATLYNNPVWNLQVGNSWSEIDNLLAEETPVLDAINEELVERYINMFTRVNEFVLDPFGGSGVVATTAARLGRIGITNDILEEQTQIAMKRWKLVESKLKESHGIAETQSV